MNWFLMLLIIGVIFIIGSMFRNIIGPKRRVVFDRLNLLTTNGWLVFIGASWVIGSYLIAFWTGDAVSNTLVVGLMGAIWSLLVLVYVFLVIWAKTVGNKIQTASFQSQFLTVRLGEMANLVTADQLPIPFSFIGLARVETFQPKRKMELVISRNNGRSYLSIIGERRGEWPITVQKIVFHDPFSLFKLPFNPPNLVSTLVVTPDWPTFAAIPKQLPFLKPTQDGDYERRSYLPNASRDKVRKYVGGDPMHLIHWKISARQQHLQVVVPEQEYLTLPKVHIFIDNITFLKWPYTQAPNYSYVFWDILDFQIRVTQVLLILLKQIGVEQVSLGFYRLSKSGLELEAVFQTISIIDNLTSAANSILSSIQPLLTPTQVSSLPPPSRLSKNYFITSRTVVGRIPDTDSIFVEPSSFCQSFSKPKQSSTFVAPIITDTPAVPITLLDFYLQNRSPSLADFELEYGTDQDIALKLLATI